MPDSLWSATTPTLPRQPALRGDHSVDVVIIGGGFMGLAAALALADRSVDVSVLEASEIAWGASGRNNGLIAPGLKRDPDEVRKILGTERGERLLRYAGDAPSTIYDLIDQYSINCDLNRGGWMQAAHSRFAERQIERRVLEWQRLGANAELIASDHVCERLGTDYYAGAWFDPRGGSLNPISFARGLAAVARHKGVAVYERSPAIKTEKTGNGWIVTTPSGSLHCEQVICCTNAYNDDVAEVRGTVVPIRTAQIASVPLSPKQARRILPGGESASDTQRLLTSFRLTADNRLIMGGASATAGDESSRLFVWLHRAADVRFPHLGSVSWEYGWSGYLALTHDHLPQILKIDNGYYAGIGCNGRGIAMATLTGQLIAALVCGRPEQDSEVPVRRPRRITGFALRRPGTAISVVANRFLDVAERRLGD